MLQRHLLGLAVALAYTSSTTAIPPTQFNCSTQPSTAFEPVTLHNNHGMIVTMIAYGATTTHKKNYFFIFSFLFNINIKIRSYTCLPELALATL